MTASFNRNSVMSDTGKLISVAPFGLTAYH